MKLSPIQLEERAAEAVAVLGNEIFNSVFADLQKEYLEALIQAEVGGLTAVQAHASMKALEAVRQKLQSYVNDYKLKMRKV